ncbi:F-box/kelch-repeat protein At3g23880-like [Solanum dulcamara]|uniref:F-box/kelch-repeat protein At3g23880-like n=1 Tax=Solanum dulcamara TaxID=45834 RepID=UPI002486CA20|nr:F-box/kelch-repeat protein At3g23880-like [Solanum dulcamara]XP_055810322.1 F-box/kelch-repeat protein At3g23880-like [Solanum dulcamara]
MESEASHQRPKRRKLRKLTQIPSTSSNSIPTLPDELIAAILVRVPVKYLLQFKCVSKNWFDLISSPEFVKTHLSFSAKDYTRHISLLQFERLEDSNMKYCSVSSLFHDDSVSEAFDLDCPMKNPPQGVYFSGSVNGLICLSNGFNELVIWNPSIRKFKKVLDFLPTQMGQCWFNCGFGYDEVHDDYKVVGIFSSMIKANFEAMIYSLKNDSLKTLEDFKPGLSYCGSPKFVKGKLHWITTRRGRQGITSIDLVDEKWGKLEQPCSYKEGDLNVGVLGGDLSVLCNSYERTHSDVWVMKEYGVKESWTKLYTIRFPENYTLSPPLFMYNEGEILFVFESTFAIYNTKNDSITYREVTNVDDSIEAELCIESLVCPDLQNND